jgi:hypothetical protein
LIFCAVSKTPAPIAAKKMKPQVQTSWLKIAGTNESMAITVRLLKSFYVSSDEAHFQQN